jgi:hypothetical protein
MVAMEAQSYLWGLKGGTMNTPGVTGSYLTLTTSRKVWALGGRLLSSIASVAKRMI